MGKVTVYEIYSVTVQVDTAYPDDRRVRPRCVWFDTLAEAQEAIGRALALPLPLDAVSVMVNRERVDAFDTDEDPDLDEWPSERHIVTGELTTKDL